MSVGERVDYENPQRCLICGHVVSVARDWPICPACKFDQTSHEAYAIRKTRGLLGALVPPRLPQARAFRIRSHQPAPATQSNRYFRSVRSWPHRALLQPLTEPIRRPPSSYAGI